MENQSLEFESRKGLEVTDFVKTNLKETANWAKFLAIMGFVGIGLMVLLAIVMFFTASEFSMMYGGPLGGFVGFIYLIMAGVYFIPVYLLYQFADRTKKAIDFNNQQSFSDAINSLKLHYKFLGIFTIVILSIYLLVFGLAFLGVLLR